VSSPAISVPYTNFPHIVAQVRPGLHEALDRVLDSGRYILGPHVAELEAKVGALLGVKHVLGVSNGTDALMLAAKALGLGPGDEVITAPNSFLASASAFALVGATPRFADVGDDMNLDPAAFEAAISPRTKAVVPVHLTGRPARMPEILAIARRRGLAVIEDCAQAIGAKRDGRPVGGWGDIGSFSCHPLKNLFSYGDGGLLSTNDPGLHQRLAIARNHGMPNRDTCMFWSQNARLDELQAALLLVNLGRFAAWAEERRRLAYRYHAALRGLVVVPEEGAGEYHVYQTYMIRTERRDELQAFLRTRGIEALTHYRTPIHEQPAAAALGYRHGDFPGAERMAATILSLPLYPGLTDSQQELVVATIRQFLHG
jgi:dTDP-4-amino-4,6-dideoxygalactose transaminase